MAWVDQNKQRAEQLAEQDEYGKSISRWLTANFPELRDRGRPHPAAIVAVLHLHHRHGRGTITVDDHGDQIRGYVQRFRERHGV